jgi:HEAT repeat protein
MDKELKAWTIVYGLDSTILRYTIQRELISLGNYAVRPLIAFVITDTTFEHEPRCLAAEALGIIRGEEATEGLLSALLRPFDVMDPVLKLEEEIVRDCICHALESIGDARAIPALLFALETYHLAGAGEALAGFREKKAIPILIKMLEDSFKRIRVSDTIIKFGRDAVDELIKTTGEKEANHGYEILPSIERRAEAARLLGSIGDKDSAVFLVDLLDDEQSVVRFESAIALVSLLQRHVPKKTIETIESLLNELSLERKLRAQEVLQWEKK